MRRFRGLRIRRQLRPIRRRLHLAPHQIACLRRFPPLGQCRRPRLPLGQPILAGLPSRFRTRESGLRRCLFLYDLLLHLLLQHPLIRQLLQQRLLRPRCTARRNGRTTT
jgi:hypothetical protein